MTVTIAANAVTAKLMNATREEKLVVMKALSYLVDGHELSSQFKRGKWDGRSSFLDFRNGTFPAGFTYYVAAHLRHSGTDVRLVKKPLPEPLGPENPVVDDLPEDPRYDYQREVVRRLLKHGQIIAQVATGGGKSRISRLAFVRIKRPTLFLTTRSVLMHQMKDSFEKDMKIPVSVLGGGQFGLKTLDEHGNERQSIKMMSVGMVQTLISRLSEPNPKDSKEKQEEQARIRAQTINLLAKFEFVILEEAHEASGNSYFEIMNHCRNAQYRLSLTATPFMKTDEEANMRLHAVSGPVAIRITEKMLIDRGILAKPYFLFVPLVHRPEFLGRKTNWQSAYRLGITDNIERNQKIVFYANRAAQFGLTSMVLVQHTKHGDTLDAMLRAAGLRVAFIQGEDDHPERKTALRALGAGQIDVLIGTNILDVGVDVPAVGQIILAGGGKAEVQLRQRIGRGLRAKKSGPNACVVIDFRDGFNEYLAKHALQRQEIIVGTPGFDEGVVKSVEDFDYGKLGFVHKAKN